MACNTIGCSCSLFENGPILEGAITYNAAAKYQHFNTQYFNGELPLIPIAWRRLKKASGRTHAQLSKSYATGKISLVEGSIRMELNNEFNRPEATFDGILLHEMIHVWEYCNGYFKENHGAIFNRKRKELEAASSIEVPVTDNTLGSEDNEYVGKPRTFYVLILEAGRRTAYSILSAPTAAEVAGRLWRNRKSSETSDRMDVYRIETTDPELIVRLTPLPAARVFPPKKLYILSKPFTDYDPSMTKITNMVPSSDVIVDESVREEMAIRTFYVPDPKAIEEYKAAGFKGPFTIGRSTALMQGQWVVDVAEAKGPGSLVDDIILLAPSLPLDDTKLRKMNDRGFEPLAATLTVQVAIHTGSEILMYSDTVEGVLKPGSVGLGLAYQYLFHPKYGDGSITEMGFNVRSAILPDLLSGEPELVWPL